MRHDTDTIFAQATPPGRAAIAVIRISGDRAFSAPSAFGCDVPEPGRFRLARLIDDDGKQLDEALILAMKGPRSSTGEDVVEIHPHGSLAVTAAIMRQLGRMDGFRPAGPGEFTHRMFANGKIDLLGAEALADLIDAETDRQRLQAWRQRDGVLHRPVDSWREALVKLAAQLEAVIDFADEDLPATIETRIREDTQALADAIELVLDDDHEAERVRSGVTISLVGPVNAGKSTLLNRLAGRDVAIVSSQAGTTRDIVSVRIDLDGVPVTILDTAGLRDTDDVIEAEGVRRARNAARDTDAALLVVDASSADWRTDLATLRDLAGPSQAALLTKRDQLDHAAVTAIAEEIAAPRVAARLVSLEDDANRDEFEQILDLLRGLVVPANRPETQSIITRERHRHALQRAVTSLRAVDGLDLATAPELAAEEYRQAADSLGRLTGQVDVEELLDSIFSSFCIGK